MNKVKGLDFAVLQNPPAARKTDKIHLDPRRQVGVQRAKKRQNVVDFNMVAAACL